MEPDAAADLLADLPEERLRKFSIMQPQERKEMVESWSSRKTPQPPDEYRVPCSGRRAIVRDAYRGLRRFEGGVETVSTIYLVTRTALCRAVPLARSCCHS